MVKKSKAQFNKTSQIEVLLSREQSTMVSTWTEYLCLKGGASKRFCLFTGRYEVLADREAFFDEDADDYVLPDEIDGKKVVGLDDDLVVGGELSWFENEDQLEFDSNSETSIIEWLRQQGWQQSDVMKKIKKCTQMEGGA